MPDDNSSMDESALRALRHDLLTQVHHLRGYGELVEEDVEDSGPVSWLEPIRELCAITHRLEPAIRSRYSGSGSTGSDELQDLLQRLDRCLDSLERRRADARESMRDDLDRLMDARSRLQELSTRSPGNVPDSA